MTLSRPLRILTWHVHGNYLYNLTQVPHEFHLVADTARSVHHTGRSGTLPWGLNVHEVLDTEVRDAQFDVVLYQSRDAWDDDRLRLLSPAQQRLPRIYVEHDPPMASPTDTRHWVDDPQALLVHVTPYNGLMWDSGRTPVRVIDHGVKPLSTARYTGHRERGLVVVNNIDLRGRRLGNDVYAAMAQRVPLTLVGMGSERVGGDGEVPQQELGAVMAAHRFFFNPIRHTSLGLAIIEAMMVGMPIVGLATTELVTVVRNGENGFIDTRLDPLTEVMQTLLKDAALARQWGDAARRTAEERFHIDRFVADWLQALHDVTA